MLEIKLIDGSTIKFEMEYIWMDGIYKDEIVSIKKIAKEENND